MRLTLAQASASIGADPTWTRNAHAVLGLPFAYEAGVVARLGLARRLHTGFGIMLPAAWRLAGAALARASQGVVRFAAPLSRAGAGETLEIDVARYLTDWAAALARVLGPAPPRRRGRPPRRLASRGLAAARRYGTDVSALIASLSRTPADRLRTLDENWRFIRKLRERAR